MSYQTLLEDIKKLPEEGYDQLVEYVEFLDFKFHRSSAKGKRAIGGLQGRLAYISDDFDDTIEDFRSICKSNDHFTGNFREYDLDIKGFKSMEI